ncbi:MAG: hypothetical protein WCD18_18850 [Thermosynechococcaceae cyanobacterium]
MRSAVIQRLIHNFPPEKDLASLSRCPVRIQILLSPQKNKVLLTKGWGIEPASPDFGFKGKFAAEEGLGPMRSLRQKDCNQGLLFGMMKCFDNLVVWIGVKKSYGKARSTRLKSRR